MFYNAINLEDYTFITNFAIQARVEYCGGLAPLAMEERFERWPALVFQNKTLYGSSRQRQSTRREFLDRIISECI